MMTYFKRFYFDDAKLRERALIELAHAFETGRMIAFVGSMATESLGYGTWDDLVRNFITDARRLIGKGRRNPNVEPQRKAALRALGIVRSAPPGGDYLDRQVALSAAFEIVSYLDEIDPLEGLPRTQLLEKAIGHLFDKRNGDLIAGHAARLKVSGLDAAKERSTVAALIEDLRIRRFATLNYDLELEAALMVEPGPLSGPEALKPLEDCGEILRDKDGRLSRLLLNGVAVESDVRSRERPDRLIDFAAGSADVDYQIMHLHGSASNPPTMVIGRRDYDLFYRKSEPSKIPFEHGQRILFAGNPVLFVGAGMTELELNATLQDFASNSPYRRFAPTFLLWGTSHFSKDKEERQRQIWLKRIDFFQRLGVLTIFDEDLRPESELVPSAYFRRKDPRPVKSKLPGDTYEDRWGRLQALLGKGRDRYEEVRDGQGWKDPTLRALDLALLSQTVQLVGRAANVHAMTLSRWQGPWRDLNQRLKRPTQRAGRDNRNAAASGVIALWKTEMQLDSGATYDFDKLFGGEGGNVPANFRVVVAPSGQGKGCLAWAVATSNDLPGGFHAPVGRRLVINAGFALDTDFLLLAISRFLRKMRHPKTEWHTSPGRSREQLFEEPDAFHVGAREALIVINGMERFFTVAGAPLSAELDHLLRRVILDTAGNVRWVFLGSSRVERYFRFLCDSSVFSLEAVSERKSRVLQDQNSVKYLYFDEVVRRIEERAEATNGATADFGESVVLAVKKRSEARPVSHAVLGAYLSAKVLHRAGLPRADLAMEIMRAMAFIGTPVEAVVLLHVPRIRKLLLGQAEIPDAKSLLDTLREMESLALVMKVTPFEAYPGSGKGLWQRFGLHTALTSELRYLFGVPLSESKLSTSFNMSLYVAQPVDGFVPEAGIHEELGTLIDHLIGAYKDAPHPDECATLTRGGVGAALTGPDRARCAPHAMASLRAALAVVRSYYSTTSLLTMDRADRRASDDRDGVLLEHAERLETLLRVFRKLRRARSAFAGGLDAKAIGPEPFYAEDLVWILNELGVIYLAQGDLYRARSSFDQVARVNAAEVEYGSHSHNWRRISINQVLLRIERGDLAGAEWLLREIETSINVRAPDSRSADDRRFDFIRKHFGEGAPEDRSCFDRTIMHEEVLVTGLVLGHRALCHHLRGNLETAAPLYKEAIAMLRRLGENRAYAFFQRHYSQLIAAMEPAKGSSVALRLALAAAESVRQMDMAYHARINHAEAAWRREGADFRKRRDAVRHLSDAVSYGSLMDLHRLRVEASMHLAGLKLDSGDYESALDHATEAMALAARYGMTLRKIGIRLMIGHILIRRGHPKSGLALIERAAEAADRFGYQRGVEAAQKIKVLEEMTA